MVHEAPKGQRSTGPLWVYALVGLAGGAAYAAANTVFDILDRTKPLVATLAAVHGFVDRGVPLLVGVLLGVAVHYWRLTREQARGFARRAEDLGHRLAHVERDQAVWVVATSTLHEVRNPIHTLGLLLDEIASLEDGPDEAGGAPTRAELLAQARAQMKRVDEAIAALRGLGRGAPPTLASVELAPLALDVAAESNATHGRAPIAVDIDATLQAHGDAGFVRIILENLLKNSTDAVSGARSGKVLVRGMAKGGRTVLQVLDNGPGIAEGSQDDVFEPLATSKVHGMGLGLAISKALARSMQGDLRIGTHTEGDEYSTCLELSLPP